MGPVLASWAAWATDPEIRHRGSSGGAITALTTWMQATSQVARVVGARADGAEPRRTVTVSLSNRDDIVSAAGSRYAPVSNASSDDALQPDVAVVGKPCEVSALRALVDPRQAPVLISFFCAGTPRQTATDDLVTTLGIPTDQPLADLWYRGRGWPGRFTAIAQSGQRVEASYDDSWGTHLGPAVQWRCKICPDGIGESADITAADYWRADDAGYPEFTESPGVSALIARTRRGRDIVERAIEAGIIHAQPLDLDALANVQPLQVNRRSTLVGRLIGARLGGASVPRFRGFALLALGVRRPRQLLRVIRGTRARVRATDRR